MSRSYYYLVAGLPDLLLDETRNVVSLAEVLADFEEQFEADDRELLKAIRYPFDNRTIVAMLDSSGAPFDSRGVFSEEDLAQELKTPEALPAYAATFVEARREGRELFAGLRPADQLAWLFYDEMSGHPNEFVAAWYSFDCDLRNVLAARNVRETARRAGEDPRSRLSTVLVGRSEVVEQILRSTAPDFGLSQLAPWSERVFALPADNLVEQEKGIDTIRWQMLDSLSEFAYFQVETILAFCIKLGMVERWLGLDAVEGKKRLEQLVNDLTSGAAAAHA